MSHSPDDAVTCSTTLEPGAVSAAWVRFSYEAFQNRRWGGGPASKIPFPGFGIHTVEAGFRGSFPWSLLKNYYPNRAKATIPPAVPFHAY